MKATPARGLYTYVYTRDGRQRHDVRQQAAAGQQAQPATRPGREPVRHFVGWSLIAPLPGMRKPLLPGGITGKKGFVGPLSDSNRRPPLYKSGALAN